MRATLIMMLTAVVFLAGCDNSGGSEAASTVTKPKTTTTKPATATSQVQHTVTAMLQLLQQGDIAGMLEKHAKLPEKESGKRKAFIDKTAKALENSDKLKMLQTVLQSVEQKQPSFSADKGIATYMLEGAALEASPTDRLEFQLIEGRWLMCNNPCSQQ